MGKGDITTRRGKIFNHSFGVYKPRRKEITNHKKTSTREHPVYLNKRKNLDLTQAATLLSRKIRLIEQNMANMLGMKIFTSENGFTQEQLYNYSGRTDDVLTITFTKGSASEKKFGEEITIILLYSLEERKKLEANSSAMNSIKFAKAKYLGTELGQNQVQELQSTGFNTNDIKEIIVSQFTKENNTFPSKQLRSTEVLDIYLEAEGCGKDIGWIYGALCRRKNNKIGLMPDDEAKYLAYKTIIANNELTEEERNSIFDKNNKIYNQEVAYYYLLWKKETKGLNNKEEKNLLLIQKNHFYERFGLVDKELNNMGLNWRKLTEKYPEKASLLFKKIIEFHDISFNIIGKYPLYMNFNTFLHVYLRHVKELTVNEQFKDRDKFQLEEKDILTVINIVMCHLNDEYQKFKSEHTDKHFYRFGKMAYYYNGDYYNVDVNLDGSINTFFKGSGNKNVNK